MEYNQYINESNTKESERNGGSSSQAGLSRHDFIPALLK